MVFTHTHTHTHTHTYTHIHTHTLHRLKTGAPTQGQQGAELLAVQRVQVQQIAHGVDHFHAGGLQDVIIAVGLIPQVLHTHTLWVVR